MNKTSLFICIALFVGLSNALTSTEYDTIRDYIISSIRTWTSAGKLLHPTLVRLSKGQIFTGKEKQIISKFTFKASMTVLGTVMVASTQTNLITMDLQMG